MNQKDCKELVDYLQTITAKRQGVLVKFNEIKEMGWRELAAMRDLWREVRVMLNARAETPWSFNPTMRRLCDNFENRDESFMSLEDRLNNKLDSCSEEQEARLRRIIEEEKKLLVADTKICWTYLSTSLPGIFRYHGCLIKMEPMEYLDKDYRVLVPSDGGIVGDELPEFDHYTVNWVRLGDDTNEWWEDLSGDSSKIFTDGRTGYFNSEDAMLDWSTEFKQLYFVKSLKTQNN